MHINQITALTTYLVCGGEELARHGVDHRGEPQPVAEGETEGSECEAGLLDGARREAGGVGAVGERQADRGGRHEEGGQLELPPLLTHPHPPLTALLLFNSLQWTEC